MKKLCLALVFLLCGITTTSKTEPSQHVNNTDEDRDFLFLGAEEPGDAYEAKAPSSVVSEPVETIKLTPPEEEENVIIVPSKKNPAKKRIVFEQKKENIGREQITPVHDKLEDTVLPQPTPYFAMRKKFGEFTLSGKFRPEAFFGKNLNFLNNCHDLDRVVFVRQTVDLNGLAKFWSVPLSEQKNGNEAVIFKFTLRDKAVWGNPASIAPTSDTPIRDLDVTYGDHRHYIGRNIVWVREVWCKASLNTIFGSSNERQHWFTIGYYPFQVGHGIALGDAYAVNPGLLGFFTENTVDQYAPGVLFSGEIIKDRWTYDLYGAIFEDKSDSLSNNAERIYEHKFGATWPLNKGRNNQSRGFGHVNWLVALKFEAVAMDSKRVGKLEIEPYILYNHAPEQRLEFPADGYSKLGTAGFDVDYSHKGFEASFEFAGNFGHQVVHGWDRNRIIHQLNSTTAAITEVNSKVKDTAISNNALFTSANQTAINASFQDETQNGQPIPGTTLVNADDRFSNPYINEYRGWMVVFDTGCWFFDKQLQIAGTFGVATGDDNPNSNFEDPKAAPVNSTPEQPGKHNFKGFVGLQEIFSGERVESVYVLGQRKLKRPLSLPNDAVENGFSAATVSEFTNLIYFGTGLHIKPNWKNKFYCRPNLLFYWQETPSRAFNLAAAQVSTTTNARNYLGAEINVFVDLFPLEDLKATLVASYFVPGTHYDDIKGTPVEPAQIKILQQIDDETDPIVLSSLPLLGTNTAFSFNFSLEYRY